MRSLAPGENLYYVFKASFSGLTTHNYKRFTWQSSQQSCSPHTWLVHYTTLWKGSCSQEFRASGYHAFCMSALLVLAPSRSLLSESLGQGLQLSLLRLSCVCVLGGGGSRGETPKRRLLTINTQYFGTANSHAFPHCRI